MAAKKATPPSIKKPIFKYTLVKKGKRQADSVIKEEWMDKQEFTVGQLNNAITNVRKEIDNLKENVKAKRFTQDNVKTHHPEVVEFIESLEPAKFIALNMWLQAHAEIQGFVKEEEQKIQGFNGLVEKKNAIKAQFKIK